ncbi:hypothetical protein Cantr_05958 [Candida viswanathii]|uniref:Hyphally-regulated cell wall protein N-terminal domain-containing protein n=1 Tax=Candida viswanathii TaxID=5486 RepID=A0A367XQ30_9ASCO|nr:hypothetical protein Cantr_05958 [Candida viswanathii]
MFLVNILASLVFFQISQAYYLYVAADNYLNGSAIVVSDYDDVFSNSTLSIGDSPTYLYFDSGHVRFYPGGSPSIWWVLVFGEDRRLEMQFRGQDPNNMPGALNITIGSNGCVAFNGSNSLFYYNGSFYSYPDGGAPGSAIPVNLLA